MVLHSLFVNANPIVIIKPIVIYYISYSYILKECRNPHLFFFVVMIMF